MCENGTRTIDLTELGLECGELHTDVGHLIVTEPRDCLLKDLARATDAKEGSGTADVELVHLRLILFGDVTTGAVVDGEGVACQTVLLLQFGVHQIDQTAVLGWRRLETLLEEVTRTLQLAATVALRKAMQVVAPDLADVRPLEERDAPLVGAERLLIVALLLQVVRIVEHRLRCGHLQIQHLLVDRTGAVERADALLEVGQQMPESRAPKQLTLEVLLLFGCLLLVLAAVVALVGGGARSGSSRRRRRGGVRRRSSCELWQLLELRRNLESGVQQGERTTIVAMAELTLDAVCPHGGQLRERGVACERSASVHLACGGEHAVAVVEARKTDPE
mmetsp:Transcript_16009/g.48094  ORF Transcript_16009/g.48094 Transcript_16009/m.48094 type:complete len:334 (-) Transcript_16009:1663-2664(-)